MLRLLLLNVALLLLLIEVICAGNAVRRHFDLEEERKNERKTDDNERRAINDQCSEK